MLWLVLFSLFLTLIASSAVFVLWLRLRRLEKNGGQRPEYSQQRGPLDSMELTLGAMLEELEAKGRQIAVELDRRAEQMAMGMTVLMPPASPSSVEVAPSVEAHVLEKPPPSERRIQPKDKAAVVHELATQGLDVDTIAQRLGLGKGEVQLILELKRQGA